MLLRRFFLRRREQTSQDSRHAPGRTRYFGRAGGRALAAWHTGEKCAARIRPIVAAFFLAFLLNAILVWAFFFVVPLILAIAVTLCLGLAYALARPARPA